VHSCCFGWQKTFDRQVICGLHRITPGWMAGSYASRRRQRKLRD
jgi:hypothetical protein